MMITNGSACSYLRPMVTEKERADLGSHDPSKTEGGDAP